MNRRLSVVSALVSLFGLAAAGSGAAAYEFAPVQLQDTETIIIPHIVDTDKVGYWQAGQDTEIRLVLGADYRGLVPGMSAANLPRSSEEVYIYLFQQDASKDRLVLNDQGQPICNPCTVRLGGTNPMRSTVYVQSLIQAGNGGVWPQSLYNKVFRGYAVLKARTNLLDVAVQADFLDWTNSLFGRVSQLAVERFD